jgi:hypothetical protein
MLMRLLEIISVGFDVTDQLLIRSFAFVKYWTVHQLFVDLKKVYDSVRREVLYSILIKFGVPMKLVRLIKMCLTFIVQTFKLPAALHGRTLNDLSL